MMIGGRKSWSYERKPLNRQSTVVKRKQGEKMYLKQSEASGGGGVNTPRGVERIVLS